jgi:probable rRNA maturation factor
MTDDDQRLRILVSNRQSDPVDEAGLVALAEQVLQSEGEGACELSVSFVTLEEMAGLHAAYLGEDGPTDVLSFPLAEPDEDGVRILGDVVIAPVVAAANNPTDPAAELRLLLAHGILHLLGYDHEQEDDRAEMWAKQEGYTGVRVP